MSVALFTEALEELVADATLLPVQVDPVRPPAIPGAVVGPPTIDYPDPDGLRIMRVTWRVGILVPTADNAWTRCAGYAEYVLSALQDSPLPWLPVHVAPEVAIVQQGEVPGYRIDVVAELAASLVARRVPPPTVLLALATLTVTGRRIGIGHATVTLTATATLVVAASRVPPGSHNAVVGPLSSAATLTVAATKRAPKAGAVAMSSAGTLAVAATRVHAATVPALTAAGTLLVAGAKPAWSPLTLPGLVGWYDASNPASLTAIAGALSQWNDLSGHGFHLTQPTSGNQPITGTTTQNGLNVVRFDGIDDNMVNVASTSLAATAVSLYVVMYVATPPFNQAQVRLGNADQVWALSITNSGVAHVQADFGGSMSSAGAFAGAAHQFSAIGGTAGAAALYIDGTSRATSTGAAGSEGKATLGSGSAIYSPVGPLFWIAEVFWANVNNATVDRQAAEAYLKAKWATP